MVAKKLSVVLSPTEQAQQLREVANLAGKKGVTAGKIKKLGDGLALLLASKELVNIGTGAKPKYVLPQFVPPSPQEKARQEIFIKLQGAEIWLEDALAGKGKDKQTTLDVIKELVRQGRLREIKVVLSASKSATGVQLVSQGPLAPAEEKFPVWEEIEPVIRRLATERVDGTVSFEDLAGALGVGVAGVKTLLPQAQAEGKRIVWVEGEARGVQNPDTAGLTLDGRVFYRFRLE